jgi:hypothetical protein
MLQAGWSRVRFPNEVIEFFNWLNPPNPTMILGCAQPLTEMSTRKITGGNGGRRVRLTSPPSVSRLCRVSRPYGSARTVTGVAFFSIYEGFYVKLTCSFPSKAISTIKLVYFSNIMFWEGAGKEMILATGYGLDAWGSTLGRGKRLLST